MKLSFAFSLLAGAQAFAPAQYGSRVVGTTARSFGVDPSVFHDLPTHVDTFKDAFSSLSLADAMDAVTDIVPAAADVAAVTDAAGDTVVAASSNGWFGFLVTPIEGLLEFFHAALVSMGMSANSWGLSILFITVAIKLLTFPLTKTQLESTNKMQSLQPQIKEVQAKYQSNPEVMNQKISELYQQNEVNPLAGCVPSVVQIPVFIGLYRAVLSLAKDDKLDEPFFFLPSLEGPTYGADPAHGSDWILKGWTDGHPSLGWEASIPFLILPVFLVISQFISMELMQPQPGPDGKKPDSPAVLKFLPLMIGWFSLNVPSALCIYWVANNLITTGTTLLIRSQMANAAPAAGAMASTSSTAEASVFAPPPMREKPSGFSSAFAEDPDIKPITAIDAEIVSDDGADAPAGMDDGTSKKRGSKKKKKKKRN
mmetsp:Transcript_23163/g.38305  ORF Transcript_23163/g.38305 Transcript_23163/m.38305 type:complete len:425 (+) Transcript_23163:101-1375(+)|eukprot:CAMPEP_0119013336 /NCGR_PEP_ID=MMETSP1176-20130426/8397_1 /TAXON_ID=265551 /ORGANISM="Synedropsis recta cf, Strain CCMP1620" /LENGTH=424 /DNA_ID=CAMNT_0006966423 /DNA_START=56 /DNA_END=1330 /DNA_ORIENTATION=-